MNDVALAPEVGGSLMQGYALFSPDEIRRMPPGMRILFDRPMRDYFEGIADELSDPKNPMTMPHLKGKKHLAFSIVRKALNWGYMDPYDVAQATSTPGGGKLMYEGKLIAGAMLNSGKVKTIKYELGPSAAAWNRVLNKFKMVPGKRTDSNGKPILYHQATYTPDDEAGLWCVGIAEMHDGSEVKTPEILLASCHPRNATPWAYAPNRQICNVAARVLAQQACPEILFGAQFDVDLAMPSEAPLSEPEPVMHTINPDEVPEAPEQNEQDDPPTAPEPTADEKKKSPRMKIKFRGKGYNKTNFVRDIKQHIKLATSRTALAEVHVDFVKALKGISDQHTALFEELNPLFKQRSTQLSDENRDPQNVDEDQDEEDLEELDEVDEEDEEEDEDQGDEEEEFNLV